MENRFTKLSSKLPSVNFYWGFNKNSPILLLDVYKHTFTFVTIDEPRQEKGTAFVVSFLKFQLFLSIYVSRPYKTNDLTARLWRTRQNRKKT